MKNKVPNFIHPELSFFIIGTAYEAFNKLGPGRKEKHYRDLIYELISKSGKKVEKEYYVPLILEGKRLGSHYFDLIVENEILVELKIDSRLRKDYFDQVYSYLTAAEKELGILLVFTKKEVIPKRIVNLKINNQ